MTRRTALSALVMFPCLRLIGRDSADDVYVNRMRMAGRPIIGKALRLKTRHVIQQSDPPLIIRHCTVTGPGSIVLEPGAKYQIVGNIFTQCDAPLIWGL